MFKFFLPFQSESVPLICNHCFQPAAHHPGPSLLYRWWDSHSHSYSQFWGRSTLGTALLLFWDSLDFNTPFRVFTKSSFSFCITSLCTCSKKIKRQ